MKVSKIFIVCVLSLVLAASILARPPKSTNFPKAVTLTIDLHPGWIGGDQEGDDLSIRCTFQNASKKAATLLLADHNDYSGTMPYPVGLQAKVTDRSGNVVTHTNTFGDWWTSYYNSSDSYREMPGDRIKLNAGAKVVRIVPLADLLRGLAPLPEGLKAGEYSVELRLGDIVSNRLKIKVAAKE